MAKKRRTAKQPVKKNSNAPRIIIWSVVAVLVLGVVGAIFFLKGSADGYYRITEEQGFVEIGYSNEAPIYLILSDLALSQVSSPGDSLYLGALTVEVPGKGSLDFNATTTELSVVTVNAEGQVAEATGYDTGKVFQKVKEVMGNYETATPEQLGDYAYELREMIGLPTSGPSN